MVAVTGTSPLLIAVKDGMLPLPLAANPMEVVLLVQLYTVPATVPEKFTAAVGALLHTTWLATAFTVGAGFTVIVNVFAVPVHVLPPLVKEGVTVMVAVTGVMPAFNAVKEPIFPVPLAASPIDGVLLVQL